MIPHISCMAMVCRYLSRDAGKFMYTCICNSPFPWLFLPFSPGLVDHAFIPSLGGTMFIILQATSLYTIFPWPLTPFLGCSFSLISRTTMPHIFISNSFSKVSGFLARSIYLVECLVACLCHVVFSLYCREKATELKGDITAICGVFFCLALKKRLQDDRKSRRHNFDEKTTNSSRNLVSLLCRLFAPLICDLVVYRFCPVHFWGWGGRKDDNINWLCSFDFLFCCHFTPK